MNFFTNNHPLSLPSQSCSVFQRFSPCNLQAKITCSQTSKKRQLWKRVQINLAENTVSWGITIIKTMHDKSVRSYWIYWILCKHYWLRSPGGWRLVLGAWICALAVMSSDLTDDIICQVPTMTCNDLPGHCHTQRPYIDTHKQNTLLLAWRSTEFRPKSFSW